ncbi:unnamed protein product [Peniophora sp. CBMAI 1063]|nr:unnamed protein product [Peniophora sp. CBMAI 1063]
MDGRDERPSWPETKLPRLEVFNERKFQFGPDALDEIQAQFIEARRQWEWELDPRDRQAAVKEIRDLCEEIFATTRTNREKKRHQVRIDKLGRHDGKRLRKHESVARDALAQQNVLARTATASIGKIDRGTGRRLSRTGSGGRMPRMYNFEKRYKGLLASQWS